ncbi:hypothetical protein G9A89_002977 [Geosiphon pyriformis]|nr:hypothetical protein G9A89_002977 [Geosiphon pyriformis]
MNYILKISIYQKILIITYSHCIHTMENKEIKMDLPETHDSNLCEYKKESIKTTNQLPPPSIVNTNGTNPIVSRTTQNEVLANFFQELLAKKNSKNQPPGPQGSS